MSDIVRIETDARLSRVVVYNGMVFLAGVTADNHNEDIRGQTAQALAKIDNYLAAAGADKKSLLTAQVWLKDIARDFTGMNQVWTSWTAPGAAPARATAQSELGLPDLLVEIVVTAALRR